MQNADYAGKRRKNDQAGLSWMLAQTIQNHLHQGVALNFKNERIIKNIVRFSKIIIHVLK